MALIAAVVDGAGVCGGLALLITMVIQESEWWQSLAVLGAVALASVTFFICLKLRVELTESLSLTDDEILYGKPAPPRIIWRIFGWDDQTQTLHAGLALDRFVVSAIGDFKRTWPRKQLVKLERKDVTDVRVEGRGKFGHITIVLGKTELDIGKRLSNEGRAWLVALLRRWRAA
jgi:hypothetical protein